MYPTTLLDDGAAFGNHLATSIVAITTSGSPPLVDWDETERFLSLLGRDAASTDALLFPPKDGPGSNKGAFKFKLGEAGKQEAERLLAMPIYKFHSLGVRPNPGGTFAKEITEGVALFCEADGGLPIEAQEAIPSLLGLPSPTVSAWSGSKSLHMYWCAAEGMALSPTAWREAQARLIAAIEGAVPDAGVDSTIRDPSRVMRAVGGLHPSTGERCRIHSEGGERYDLAGLVELLPPLPERKKKKSAESADSRNFPSSTEEEIVAALHCVPRRPGAGSGTYPLYRNLLWGLIAALKDTDLPYPEEEAIALMEAHSPSEECGWDVEQVGRSGGEEINAGTFWHITKENGYRRKSSSAKSKDSAKEDSTLGWTALISLTLEAIRNGDKDEEMELRAEISGRFRRNDSQVDAALFRLLTEQEAGPRKAASAESVDLRAVKGLDYLVEGFQPSHGLGLAHGSKGVGKTTAAVALSFAVVDGKGFLDHSKPARQGKVLFCASDSGAGPLLTVLQDMGLGEHPATIPGPDQRFFVWAHDADQGHAAWDVSVNGCVRLLQFVKEEGIDLVVIDSAKAVCAKGGISYMDNDAVNALLTFFKEAIAPYTSVLFLSHDGTAQGSHAGAKAWAEIVDIVHRQTMKEGEHHSRQWTVVKNRLGPTREFSYSLEEGELTLSHGTETIGDATSAILTVLREALTAKEPKKRLSRKGLHEELMRRFDYAPKTIDNTLQRLVQGKAPRLVRQGKGFYALSPKELYRGCLVGGEEWTLSPVISSEVPTTRALPEGGSVGNDGQSQNRPPVPMGNGVGNSRVMAIHQSPTGESDDSSPQGGTTPLGIPLPSEFESVETFREGQWRNGWIVEKSTKTMAGTYFTVFRQEDPSEVASLHQDFVRPCAS